MNYRTIGGGVREGICRELRLSASKPAEIAVTIDGQLIGTTTIGAQVPYARTTAILLQATLEQGICKVTATVDGKATLLGKFTIQP